MPKLCPHPKKNIEDSRRVRKVEYFSSDSIKESKSSIAANRLTPWLIIPNFTISVNALNHPTYIYINYRCVLAFTTFQYISEFCVVNMVNPTPLYQISWDFLLLVHGFAQKCGPTPLPGLGLPMPRPYRPPYLPGLTALIPHFEAALDSGVQKLGDKAKKIL